MNETTPWELVPRAKRIVLKVGTSSLTKDGQLQPDRFTALARDVAALMEEYLPNLHRLQAMEPFTALYLPTRATAMACDMP